METVNIISSIFIYLVLPLAIVIGLFVIFRRHRERKAGRPSSLKEKPLSRDDIRDVKAEQADEARHQKQSPRNIDPETGRQPGADDPEKL